MKPYSKIVVLVALALLLTLTACQRSASQSPAVVPTNTGEAGFPFVTEDPIALAGTQTAIASAPVDVLPTETPQVVLETETPAAGEGTTGEGTTGEGTTDQQPQPGDAATATPDPNAGGGAEQPALPVAGPTPVITRPETYTLQQGEFPFCIARRYDLDVSSFFSLNGFNMNSKPAAGTTVKIPATGNWNTSAFGSRQLRPHPTTHSVAAGQNVYSIACYYGDVAPESILAANSFSSASDVSAGKTINIP